MRSQPAALGVGDHLPNFELCDARRERVAHADFAGAVAVLAFYPRAFSSG